MKSTNLWEDYQRLSEDQHDKPEQSPIQTEQATITSSSNNQSHSRIEWLKIARWAILLPVAAAAAYLASRLAIILTLIGMGGHGDLVNSFWPQLILVQNEHITIGYVFAVTGVAIAPRTNI